ncbi:MAG: cytochrome c biogenesis protein CcmG/thiol:disulfide interchange protein DsbE [Lysobacterales bacterium]|jgi:cytochrome c biogenesis protein CcmG/thiol:disulfide interchange protein DsbE
MKNLLTIVLSGLVILGLGVSTASAQFMMENPNVGKAALDFTLPTTTNKAVNFTEYRGDDKAIIFFWATWCPNCPKHLKALSEKEQMMLDKGIKVVAIDLGESINVVAKYAKRKKVDLDIFVDVDSKLEEPYGLIGVPTFFFVGNDGVIKAVKHSLPADLDKIFN